VLDVRIATASPANIAGQRLSQRQSLERLEPSK
jgi:hypothetical protein